MNVKVPNLLCSSGTWGHSLRHLPVIRRGAEVNGAISKPFRNNLHFAPLASAHNVPCATLSRTMAPPRHARPKGDPHEEYSAAAD